MKPLSHYLDTPAVQDLQERYGSSLQGMDIEVRLHLMQALTSAAAAVQQHGISENLSNLILDIYPSAEASLLGLLMRLDAEMTSWGEAVALVNAIAESLCYVSV